MTQDEQVRQLVGMVAARDPRYRKYLPVSTVSPTSSGLTGAVETVRRPVQTGGERDRPVVVSVSSPTDPSLLASRAKKDAPQRVRGQKAGCCGKGKGTQTKSQRK